MDTIVNINRTRLYAVQESLIKLCNEFGPNIMMRNADRIVLYVNDMINKFNNISKDKTTNTIPIKFINLYLFEESLNDLLSELNRYRNINGNRFMDFDAVLVIVRIVCKRFENLQY